MSDSTASQLRSRLAMSAGHHAGRALKAYQEYSPADFYLNAGTALELAIKARLVGAHGIHCLAPDGRGWFATMVQLSRDVDGVEGRRARTVEAGEALLRLSLLEPELPDVFSKNVRQTLDRRNIGAHIGHGAEPSPADFLSHAAAFVRAVSLLLRHDPVAFWGDLAALAESLVEDELNAVRVRVRSALAHSKMVRSTMRQEAFEALEESSLLDLAKEDAQVVPVECPGCHGAGWAVGRVVDEGDAEVDDDHGEVHAFWVPDLYLVIEEFMCGICDLNLLGHEEITEAGLPTKVPNPRASPSDALDAFDYDLYD